MRVIGAVLVGGIITGCGGEGGGSDGTTPSDFPRACDESGDDGDCVLFSGADWVETDVLDACAVTPVGSCPTAGSVGTCTIDGGTGFETVTTFYQGFWDGSQAAQNCQSAGGAFSEP